MDRLNPQTVISEVERIVKRELPEGYRLEKVDLGYGILPLALPSLGPTFQVQIHVLQGRSVAHPAGWGGKVARRIREKWSAEDLGISVLERPKGCPPFGSGRPRGPRR
ncbi:MAG: hypothetical protein O7H41_18290 [Planctomycetota bacterium]|nr:hypothetical protein [Planctomycetota bacterium]